MKLTFLGTRGEIEARTRLHWRHTCLLIESGILIDCGLDWLGKVRALAPEAIVLTHAHSDHAGGLKRGAPCPVYATPETLRKLARYPIENPRTIHPRQPFTIRGVVFEAFTVEHSLIAPAVGYRITRRGSSVFYAPDLVYIHEQPAALDGIVLYIGDGAAIKRPLVRRRGASSIGHASVGTQLDWCRAEGVPRAVITHCGSEIVKGNADAISAKIRALAEERGIDALVAYDGLELTVGAHFPESIRERN